MTIEIRAASAIDGPSLQMFACANAGERWTRDAEDIIKSDVAEAVLAGGASLSVFVALDGQSLVGVVAASFIQLEGLKVHVLAVAPTHRRQGIGTDLKRRAMSEYPNVRVVSEVHRKNTAMLGLNATLNAFTDRDPDDYNYRVSVIDQERSSFGVM